MNILTLPNQPYVADLTPDIESLLRANAPVAVGVSGGKDSQAAALVVARHLDSIGHTGPRTLIHSSLGRVEWVDSMPVCEELAAHLGWELVVVRRKAGDMMDRWLQRWHNNVERYANLECVRLIPPWSTPSMRFCTGEMKSDVIASALKKRYPKQQIISATGIRAQESSARAKQPIAKVSSRLTTLAATGWDWNPILGMSLQQVWDSIASAGLRRHRAYVEYGTTRVSCRFCILGSLPDLMAASDTEEARELYSEMVQLELDSTFGFQDARWLASLRPDRLPERQQLLIESRMAAARERREIEKAIPESLLFKAGPGRRAWPARIPTLDEARELARVRREVARIVGLEVRFIEPHAVIDRYAELMEERGTLPGRDIEETQAVTGEARQLQLC